MSPGQYRARVQIARRIIEAGGCFVTLADELGLTKAAISVWFKNHPELADVRDALAANTRTGRQIVGSESKRIRLMVQVARKEMTLREAASLIGVSPPALVQWRNRNWIVLDDALSERKAA
jgi:predicted transcriptional regulator